MPLLSSDPARGEQQRTLYLTPTVTQGGGDPYHVWGPTSSQYWTRVLCPPEGSLWAMPDLWRKGLVVDAVSLAQELGVDQIQQSRAWIQGDQTVDELQICALAQVGEHARLLVEWTVSEFVHSGHGDSGPVWGRAWIDLPPACSADKMMEFIKTWERGAGIARELKIAQAQKDAAWQARLQELELDERTIARKRADLLAINKLDDAAVNISRKQVLRPLRLLRDQVEEDRSRVLRETDLDEASVEANQGAARAQFEATYQPKK